MAKVESVKCPNCGGSLRGVGQVICPYCGSTLDVSTPDKSHLKQIAVNFGSAGRTLATGQTAHFKDLPTLPITPRTTEIPFQPKVTYDKLPGGTLDPALQSEARAIVALAETNQTAVNKEDLDLYLTTLHPEYPAFYEKARRGAEAQFVTGDMKRYTTAVDFTSLTRELATVNVTIEAFIFFPTGRTNHVEATFAYKLKKYEGAWKVYDSAIKGKKFILPAGGKIGIIVALAGLLVGLIAACAAIFATCRDEAAETITSVTVETSEGDITVSSGGSTGPQPDEKGYYVATTGIPLYKHPDLSSPITTVITPGAKFKVTQERRDWFKIKSEDGAHGWVPAVILEQNLGAGFTLP